MTVTLVTGANKGIGFETARQLLALGHVVYVGARDVERGEKAAAELGARFVRLDVTDGMIDLAASEFDIAIRGMTGPMPGLVCHFLMRMPVTPLATPDFLARHPLKAPADLLSVPRLSPDDDWWDLWFESLSEPGDPRQAGIRFESQVLDGHAAIAGHGVAILSPPMFQAQIDAGQLVQPFPHVATYRNGFWLVYPEHKRNLPKVRHFRDWLLDAVKRAAGDDPYGILVPLV